MAAIEAADEIVLLKLVITIVLCTEDKSLIIVDSEDLYHALFSKGNTSDKSLRPDVNVMRFFVETVIGVFSWIDWRLDLFDVGSKKDISITDALMLTVKTAIRHLYLTNI